MTWIPLRDRWLFDDTTTSAINSLAGRLEREAYAAHHRSNCCPEGAVIPENCRYGGGRYAMSVDEVLGALVAGGWLPRAALVAHPAVVEPLTPPPPPPPAPVPPPHPATPPPRPRSAVNEARSKFAEEAKAAYLDAHPRPTELSVSCPRCKARVGQRCVWGKRPKVSGARWHVPRTDRVIAVVHAQEVGAIRAFDAAWDAWGAQQAGRGR